MIVFISGLPGAGKTTVGTQIAEHFGWQFFDADTVMTSAAKAKTQSDELLSKDELTEWITDTVIPEALELEKNGPVVVAGWVATEANYQLLKNSAENVLFLYLQTTLETLLSRTRGRTDHVAGEEIVRLCWRDIDTLCLPGTVIDNQQSVENVVRDCVDLISKEQE